MIAVWNRTAIQDIFGVLDLYLIDMQAEWQIFATKEHRQPPPSGYVLVYHGTTLHQLLLILQEGFKCGKYHTGTKSSPCGICSCSSVGDALDRTHFARGRSRRVGEEAVSPWAIPIALGMHCSKTNLYKHKRLNNVL